MKNDLELAADALDTGADIIKKHGWVQGYGGNETVGFCMLSGYEEAKKKVIPNRNQQRAIVHDLAYREVKSIIGDAAWSAWNDAKGRTKRQVLAALRKGAKNLRKRAES